MVNLENQSSNVFPAIKGEALRELQADVPAREEDIDSTVNVTIMRNATATRPSSLTQPRQTFRPGNASTRVAGLRRPSLVNFNKRCAPSGGLVFQHLSERAPACIQDRFGHLGLCEGGSVHISNGDQSILASQFGARDMKMVVPSVGDLGMDRAYSAFVPSALRRTEGDFVLPIMLQGRDFTSIAAYSKGFQAEINANFTRAGGQIIGYFAGKCGVPAAARVLNEGSADEFPIGLAMLPQAEALLEVPDAITFCLQRPWDIRNPSQGAALAEAGTEAWAFAVLVAGFGKLPAYLRDCIGMQAEINRTTCAEFAQINPSEPLDVQSASAPTLRFALSGNKEIPDLIALNGKRVKALTAGTILDSEFESEDAHVGSVLSVSGPIKNASRAGKPSGRSSLIPQQERRFLPAMNGRVSAAKH